MTAALRLTPRQRDVVELLSQGLRCAQIARRLGITERTVRAHVANVAVKLMPSTQPPIRRIVVNADRLLAR